MEIVREKGVKILGSFRGCGELERKVVSVVWRASEGDLNFLGSCETDYHGVEDQLLAHHNLFGVGAYHILEFFWGWLEIRGRVLLAGHQLEHLRMIPREHGEISSFGTGMGLWNILMTYDHFPPFPFASLFVPRLGADGGVSNVDLMIVMMMVELNG